MFLKPRALKEPEIEEIVDRFGFVARVARETGFTGVQIHAAHGYLVSQFLSPVTNLRQDQYGGPLKARAKFLLDIVRNVRETVGAAYPISVKLNSSDFQKGGFSAEECRQVVIWLVEAGIDLLEISGGSYEQPRMMNLVGDTRTASEPLTASTARREAYFLDYARSIRAVCPIPLLVTGGFRTRAAMDAALADGACDMIGLARPLCVEPDLPKRLLDDPQAVAQNFDSKLRLGASHFLGPQSPFRLIKSINGFGQQAWYCEQLRHLAQGQPPDMSLGILSALRVFQASEKAKAKAISILAR
jgi:2,4-dienoyl-CoA reductase-like NADH-dependent reductase (Old Yellow Enzyme family)